TDMNWSRALMPDSLLIQLTSQLAGKLASVTSHGRQQLSLVVLAEDENAAHTLQGMFDKLAQAECEVSYIAPTSTLDDDAMLTDLMAFEEPGLDETRPMFLLNFSNKGLHGQGYASSLHEALLFYSTHAGAGREVLQ